MNRTATALALMVFCIGARIFACDEMEIYNEASGMCEGRAMPGMKMGMVMLTENAFATQNVEEGSRGVNAFAVPNMFMADFGHSVGNRNYLNVDVMATFEKWTFPKNGSPELLQIGEERDDGQPFLDAQHPHSSPIMGLTLSDTISLAPEQGELKLFVAPRGESTDGPVPFMHRQSAMINPNVPLGHHIGQDVGHISSTVAGAMLHWKSTRIEASTFYGQEPDPTAVDLKTAAPNSYAVRITQRLNPERYVMMSAAYVRLPEQDQPDLHHIWRYSASIYGDHPIGNDWMWHNALIYGLVNYYDHAAALNSFMEEAVFQKRAMNIWGRLEVLQRTPGELEINSFNLNQPNEGRWVTALTLGYSHDLKKWNGFVLRAGGSLTRDFIPRFYQTSYSGNPLSGQIFLQLGGMTMFDSGT